METYKNIDEFIEEAFPLEVQKITKRVKSEQDENLEKADAEFDEKLNEIINGKDAAEA